MQNNNPKHFLAEEEFVQLRMELAKENIPNKEVEGETDGELPAEMPTEMPAEELPPGTEDLPDPAKV